MGRLAKQTGTGCRAQCRLHAIQLGGGCREPSAAACNPIAAASLLCGRAATGWIRYGKALSSGAGHASCAEARQSSPAALSCASPELHCLHAVPLPVLCEPRTANTCIAVQGCHAISTHPRAPAGRAPGKSALATLMAICSSNHTHQSCAIKLTGGRRLVGLGLLRPVGVLLLCTHGRLHMVHTLVRHGTKHQWRRDAPPAPRGPRFSRRRGTEAQQLAGGSTAARWNQRQPHCAPPSSGAKAPQGSRVQSS